MAKHLDAYEEDRARRVDKILTIRADEFRRRRPWWGFGVIDDVDLPPIEDAIDSLLATGYDPDKEVVNPLNVESIRVALSGKVQKFYLDPWEFECLNNLS